MSSGTADARGQMSQPPLVQVSGVLTPRAPFDFAQTLAFMRAFTPMVGEQRLTAGALTKAVALHGRAVIFSVWSEGTVEQPRLAYTLTSARPLSEADLLAMRDRITFFLSLDDDLAAFYARAQGDDALAPLIAQRYGLHQPKFLSPYEIACWAILTQRTPMTIARQIKDRLSAHYGASLTVDGVAYRAFPEADTLVGAEPDELRAIVRNARKVEYLQAISAFFSGADEAWLRAGPIAEVTARLRGVRGVGEWSAMFILVRGLGRMEAAPTSDEELLRAAGRLYNAGAPLTPAGLAPLLERYGPTRGYWAFYCRAAG